MGKGKRIKGNKRKAVATEEQIDLAPKIQEIVQEEHQYVLDNLEEFEGLSEKQIQGKVLVKVRKRCETELGMEIGH